MHELSIAQSLIEEVNHVAESEGATGVLRVAITVGALSGVDPEALEAVFPIAADGSLATGARLDITTLPARVLCNECGKETCPEYPLPICGDCGAVGARILEGTELLMTAVELNVDEAEGDSVS